MKFQLSFLKKTHKNTKRRGRGPSSQNGGTSCRGHKGQKARSGYRIIPGFEGGQTGIHRILPKYGFTSLKKKSYSTISILDAQAIINSTSCQVLTKEHVLNLGLINKSFGKVKILNSSSACPNTQVKISRDFCYSESLSTILKYVE